MSRYTDRFDGALYFRKEEGSMADVDEDQLTAMTPAQKKLFELRMKMNAGRKANKKEVAAEHDRVNNQDQKAKKEERYKKRVVR
ncbi:hypothetical protein BBJ28_00000234 [Nothophytophthora sp. Chile5]|nr:hypothetical protein BBJ28_00000234 [Nothophytophthora sp. Chile5]